MCSWCTNGLMELQNRLFVFAGARDFCARPLGPGTSAGLRVAKILDLQLILTHNVRRRYCFPSQICHSCSCILSPPSASNYKFQFSLVTVPRTNHPCHHKRKSIRHEGVRVMSRISVEARPAGRSSPAVFRYCLVNSQFGWFVGGGWPGWTFEERQGHENSTLIFLLAEVCCRTGASRVRWFEGPHYHHRHHAHSLSRDHHRRLVWRHVHSRHACQALLSSEADSGSLQGYLILFHG